MIVVIHFKRVYVPRAKHRSRVPRTKDLEPSVLWIPRQTVLCFQDNVCFGSNDMSIGSKDKVSFDTKEKANAASARIAKFEHIVARSILTTHLMSFFMMCQKLVFIPNYIVSPSPSPSPSVLLLVFPIFPIFPS